MVYVDLEQFAKNLKTKLYDLAINKKIKWCRAFIEVCDTLKDCEKIEIIKCEKCRYFFDDCCNNPKNKVAHKCPDFGEHYSYAEGITVNKRHFCSYAEPKEIEGE